MSAAFRLTKAGIHHRVFEREPQPGGLVITVEERGYRFDRTGHLLHVADRELREQALAWIGSEVHEIERRSMIWSHGVYTRYPFQANTYGLPPKVAYECVMGFVEAWQTERERAERASPIENFEQYCLAKFGRGFSKHFMVPYNTRLWGVQPSEITADWCERFVPVPSLGDVIAGAVGMDERQLGYNVRFLYPRGGIGRLTEGLARSLDTLELGRCPDHIDVARRELVFKGERVPYEALISTAPLPSLIELLSDTTPELRRAAASLRCTPLYYLDVALRTPCRKPYHWVYVPEPHVPFYRVGCYSSFCADMAPVGKASLYVELADRTEPDLRQLLPEVARWLTTMQLIVRPEDILFARLRRIDHAYVVFDHHYQAALEQIWPALRDAGIWSCGRYGGWTYSSMADALTAGREAADDVMRQLGQSVE